MNEISKREDSLFEHVSKLIDEARKHLKTTIDTTMVYTYYGVGKYIVEDEQQGETRAAYGKTVLKRLSVRLTEKYGKGWSYSNLRQIRQFYMVYSDLTDSVCQIHDRNDRQCLSNSQATKLHQLEKGNTVALKFTLSWSHYLVLMRIANQNERNFYEIECYKQNWSVRQLQRQYNSSLYERLALSRNKDEVMRLAQEGQTVEKASDVIKSPLTLEFLGLKPEAVYSESKLESAIISKIQDFLLELGKGFLFEARQKRFTFDEQNFYVDLVLYNRLLQCYCLIDLKIDKLTHQDLGQMQMYVNYFDRFVKQDFEKPTIGILLCKEKNDALVELTLPKNANIYASAYRLYLPDKALLQAKVKEWITEFEENEELMKHESNE